MSGFGAALRVEALKARRSRVPLAVATGFSLVALVDALFMFILQDPERARSWGILGSKAQLAAGVADWPTYLGLLAQSTALGGLLVFSFVMAWLFGREFSERTVKELLATPTPRAAIVAAKLVAGIALMVLLSAIVILLGVPLGRALELPGATPELLTRGVIDVAFAGVLTAALTPVIAFVASVGRGYLAPLGAAILSVFLAQIAAATGWGAWFPWSVPSLFSGAAGPRAELVEWYSYVAVLLAGLAGAAATFAWWLRADQSR